MAPQLWEYITRMTTVRIKRFEEAPWTTRSPATNPPSCSITLRRFSAIPRGSGNEKGISDYLVAFAKDHGLWVYQDDVYNVIIKKPASAGAEGAPAVMLQGHIDMVCDKLAGVEHDFEKDGIDLVVRTAS